MKITSVISIMCAMSMMANTAAASHRVLSPKAHMASKAVVSLENADESVSVYVTIDPSATNWDTLAEQFGLHTAIVVDSTATARIKRSMLGALAEAPGVRYVEMAAPARQMLDIAKPEVKADLMNNGHDIYNAYTGNGVVVGVVDAGFDYNHAAFRNPTTGESRIKRIWEQHSSDFEGCTAPEKFGYGIELTTPELIAKAAGDNSVNSHGTHVAAIATGSDSYLDGAYRGTAPDADIVLVAVDLNTCQPADISNAVAYIYDYATAVGKPCVVNLSLGNHAGPHDGTSSFDAIADKLQGPGRLIVGAAGNHRADKFHICHSFASADESPLRTFVAYKNSPSTSNVGGDIEIWADEATNCEITVSAYSIFNKKDMVSNTVWPNDGSAEEFSFGSYATGTYAVAGETSPLNGKTHIVLSSHLTNIRNNFAIAITVTPKNAGVVDIWADNAYVGLESRNIDGFSDANGSTIAEIGGTGKRILTVGAYTTRNNYVTTTASGSLNETVGAVSSFSSCGPTADGRIKPDVSAPGCMIISALSANDASGTQMVASSYSEENRTYSYGYMQGTSMSSPLVAGIVASWLQAYPELSPEELHEIATSSARNDLFTGDIAATGSNDWGYGKIDAFAGLQQCVAKASSGISNALTDACSLIRCIGNSIEVSFASNCRADIGIYATDGRIVASLPQQSVEAGDVRTIDISALSRGMYIIKVNAGNAAHSLKFIRH